MMNYVVRLMDSLYPPPGHSLHTNFDDRENGFNEYVLSIKDKILKESETDQADIIERLIFRFLRYREPHKRQLARDYAKSIGINVAEIKIKNTVKQVNHDILYQKLEINGRTELLNEMSKINFYGNEEYADRLTNYDYINLAAKNKLLAQLSWLTNETLQHLIDECINEDDKNIIKRYLRNE